MRNSLLRLRYQNTTVEKFTKQSTVAVESVPSRGAPLRDSSHNNASGFDVVVASEVIEHVCNPDVFISHCADLVKPNGILVVTTPNRTLLSFMAFILFGEYVARILPIVRFIVVCTIRYILLFSGYP